MTPLRKVQTTGDNCGRYRAIGDGLMQIHLDALIRRTAQWLHVLVLFISTRKNDSSATHLLGKTPIAAAPNPKPPPAPNDHKLLDGRSFCVKSLS